MLTRTSEIATKALLHLALSRTENGWVSPRAIADQLELSQSYFSKVITMLSRANIMRAQRGLQGGVQLNRSPEEISLLDIVEACQGKILADYCESSGQNGCTFHSAMKELHRDMVTVLSRWRLVDLMLCPEQVHRDGIPCKMAGVSAAPPAQGSEHAEATQ